MIVPAIKAAIFIVFLGVTMGLMHPTKIKNSRGYVQSPIKDPR